MPEPADADDADAIARAQAVLVQRAPHRRAAARQRARVLARDGVGDLDEPAGVARERAAEAARVEIGVAELLAVLAGEGAPLEAVLAVPAVLLRPAEADALADAQVRDARGVRAQLLDDADALVAQPLVGVPVVLVGAADAGVPGERW